MDQNPPAFGERRRTGVYQPSAVGFVPVVQHVGEEVGIATGWPRGGKHVGCHNADAVGERGRLDRATCNRIHRWRFHHDGLQVQIGLGARNRVDARTAAHVEQSANVSQVNSHRQCGAHHPATAVHRGSE